MSAHFHWWLPAVSFALGLVLTFVMTLRRANVQMPAWVTADFTKAPSVKPEPPAMKVPANEAPTQRIPVTRPRPAKKTVSKGPPKKRRPVTRDAVTERIPTVGDPATERIPVGGDPVTERIPVPRKRPAKKVPAKKVRPRDPTRRVAKRPAPKQLPATEPQTVQLPLVPYAPYGPGSMRADPDGGGPEGWTVKGRTDARLYFTPEDRGYDRVEAQVWFESEDFATRAFFLPGRDHVTEPEPDDDDGVDVDDGRDGENRA